MSDSSGRADFADREGIAGKGFSGAGSGPSARIENLSKNLQGDLQLFLGSTKTEANMMRFPKEASRCHVEITFHAQFPEMIPIPGHRRWNPREAGQPPTRLDQRQIVILQPL